MIRNDVRSRRRVLQFIAATKATSMMFIVGCVDQEGEGDEGVEQILLENGEDEIWIGQEHAEIEGEDNPSLELVEGWRYELEYVNRDGDSHNLEIWAGNEERQATDVDDEEREEQTRGIVHQAVYRSADPICS